MKQIPNARRRAAAGRRKQSASKTAFRPFSAELVIEDIGGLGEGIARHDGKTVFVPLTVPGDRIEARIESKRGDALAGTLVRLLDEGPGRAAPPCPWFGICGGCALQHLDDALYSEWKTGLAARAFERRGIAAHLAPLVRIPAGTRRRVTFSFLNRRDGLLFGFHRRAGHVVADVGRCLLLDESLNAAFPALRDGVASCCAFGVGGSMTVIDTDNGLDVLLEAPLDRSLEGQEKLAAFAEKADLARLSWKNSENGQIEPLLRRRPPTLVFGAHAVEPPPGGFLQPSREGEAVLRNEVMAALRDVKGTVFDLYSGCGTFSLPLAGRGPVQAFEGEEAPVSALASAAARDGLSLQAHVRDLARRPLLASELKGAAAVVFDPPRAGAIAQVEQIATMGSNAPARIVAVSCNPASFVRDASVLLDGPYDLVRAMPVDQFPYSPHLEIVAVFHRRG